MAYIKRNRWTAAQVNYLEQNWDKFSDEKMADHLGKTLKSIRRKRERMLLKKASGRGIVKAFNDTRTVGQLAGAPTIKSSEPDSTPFNL